MRKTWNRVASLFLVMLLTLSLGVTALAAGDVQQGGDFVVDDPSMPIRTLINITFDEGDKSGVLDGQKSISIYAGSLLAATQIPAQKPNDGYEFAGWVVKGNESQGVVDLKTTSFHKDTVLIAVWQLKDGVKYPALITEDHIAYMKGDEKGNFNPDANMTRAEAATVFYNLLVEKNVENTANFSDIASSDWYAAAVNTLASLKIINGYPDGTFRPNSKITRAEFVTISSKFFELTSTTVSFTDVATGHWAYAYISNCVAKKWVSGYPDGSFRPEKNITRAEVVSIVNNILGRVADNAFVDSHTAQLKLFPDVAATNWAYYRIAEATNAHDYTKTADSETWTALK